MVPLTPSYIYPTLLSAPSPFIHAPNPFKVPLLPSYIYPIPFFKCPFPLHAHLHLPKPFMVPLPPSYIYKSLYGAPTPFIHLQTPLRCPYPLHTFTNHIMVPLPSSYIYHLPIPFKYTYLHPTWTSYLTPLLCPYPYCIL